MFLSYVENSFEQYLTICYSDDTWNSLVTEAQIWFERASYSLGLLFFKIPFKYSSHKNKSEMFKSKVGFILDIFLRKYFFSTQQNVVNTETCEQQHWLFGRGTFSVQLDGLKILWSVGI